MVDANRSGGGQAPQIMWVQEAGWREGQEKTFQGSIAPGEILEKERPRDMSKEPAKLVRNQPRKTEPQDSGSSREVQEADPGTSHRRRPHTWCPRKSSHHGERLDLKGGTYSPRRLGFQKIESYQERFLKRGPWIRSASRPWELAAT